MKKILLILSIISICLEGYAQQVSLAEANSRAMNFLQQRHTTNTSVHKVQSMPAEVELAYTCTRETDNKVCFYVFNQSGNGGFVIVGGDDSAKDILGYSETGSFDYNSIPDNFKWWLSQYQQQISYAMDFEESRSNVSSVKRAKAFSKSSVSPLLQTKWDQDDPYNSALPSLGEDYTGNYALATGCTATAMAQIMKYHNYPATGVGQKSYTQSFSGIATLTFAADFANTNYDWENMTNTYSSASTQEQKDAVATLMYHCGVSLETEYGQIANGGSGAYTSKIARSFYTNFKYSKAVRLEDRDYYTDEAWEQMIHNQLTLNRPVLYVGASSGGGHAFICDGYNSAYNTFHINWGWGGSYDCYCVLTGAGALTPGGSGIGGAGDDSSYSKGQGAVIDIIPDETVPETPLLILYTGTSTISDGSSSYSSYNYECTEASYPITLVESVQNKSNTLTSFTFGVKATDTTTGEVCYWTCQDDELNVAYKKKISLSFDPHDLPHNGTYEIRGVARRNNSTSDDDWYEIEVNATQVLPTVTVSGHTDPAKTDVVVSLPFTTLQSTRTMQVAHDKRYSGTLTYSSSNNNIATVDEDGVITGVNTGKATITVSTSETTYFNATTKQLNVQVTLLVKEDANPTVSATELIVSGTAQISIPKDYDATPVYSSSDVNVAEVDENGIITAKTSGTATITVTLPEASYYTSGTYTYIINVQEASVILTKCPYFSNNNNPFAEDTNLYFSILNATSTKQNAYFLVKLYSVATDGTTTYMGGRGIGFELEANESHVSSYDMSIYPLVEGQKYLIKFIKNLEDNWSNPYNITDMTFTYRPTFNATAKVGYSTLILPVDADIPNGMKVYSCDAVNVGDDLVLTEEHQIKANTPYITYNSDELKTFTGPNIVDNVDTYTDGILTGLVRKTTVPAGSYVLQTKNNVQAFYQVKADATGQAYRCYLTLPTEVKGLYLHRNDTDAVSTLSSLVSNDIQEIYTLNGSRVPSLQKGINIVKFADGSVRKIMVK